MMIYERDTWSATLREEHRLRVFRAKCGGHINVLEYGIVYTYFPNAILTNFHSPFGARSLPTKIYCKSNDTTCITLQTNCILLDLRMKTLK
jgi:hypothetical protein